MKKNRILISTLTIGLVIMLTTLNLNAQNRQGKKEENPQRKTTREYNKGAQNSEPAGPFRNFVNIPNITDNQKEEIRKIRLELIKEMGKYKDQINEKQARLRTLSHADKPDTKSMDKLVDEIAELKAKIQKLTLRAKQEIRALLTDEQKVWFDSRCSRASGHYPACKAQNMQKVGPQGRYYRQ